MAESSSFRLRAVDGLSVGDVWRSLSTDVHDWCVDRLGLQIAIDVDQCWVRRQYAPRSAPPRHHPHTWHQDGALGFDFAASVAARSSGDGLLRMVTCWIALTPCGVDAPGLERVIERVHEMLMPPQLRDGAVDDRWPSARREQPVLAAGDALVFTGDVLHRTHTAPEMTNTRTSIELRCFAADAIPHRLAGDEFDHAPM